MANSNETLREALVGLIDGICFHCDMSGDCKGMPCEKMQKAKAALALPRRQCDVGTPEEQEKRFNRFCGARHLPRREVGIYCAYKCPVEGETSCELQWAQMPYDKGEPDGSK